MTTLEALEKARALIQTEVDKCWAPLSAIHAVTTCPETRLVAAQHLTDFTDDALVVSASGAEVLAIFDRAIADLMRR